jgi:peroxiredoxin Q/BCP
MRKTLVAVLLVLGLGVFAWRTLAPAADPDKLLKVGDAFPAWSLRDQTGAAVASQSLAGKTYLLWFYPKAQTPGCTAEGRGLRDRFDEFRSRGVEIVGVSFDTPEANAEFVKAEGFQFRLLSDTDHTLARAVGAASSDNQLVASRISYLVGPDGTVKKTYGEVTPATHAGSVLSDL